MSDAAQILSILIERDIDAFVAIDWDSVAPDFDTVAFTGYSGQSGAMRLRYPTLESYRQAWLEQAEAFRGSDPELLARQLYGAQRLERIEIQGDRALATKIFDGDVDGPSGTSRLAWTTYYFLRFASDRQTWLITGFAGYLPADWNAR